MMNVKVILLLTVAAVIGLSSMSSASSGHKSRCLRIFHKAFHQDYCGHQDCDRFMAEYTRKKDGPLRRMHRRRARFFCRACRVRCKDKRVPYLFKL